MASRTAASISARHQARRERGRRPSWLVASGSLPIHLTGLGVALSVGVLLESLLDGLLVLLVLVLVAVAAGPLRRVRAWHGPDDADLGALTSASAGSARGRVLLVSASIGAGHDGAAVELAREAREAGYLVDQVDFLDLLPLGLGRVVRSTYRWQITVVPSTWGFVLRSFRGSSDTQWVSWLAGSLARRRLLRACGPDTCVVVSTYPLASHALSRLRSDGSLDVPAVTYLTDMSVHPLWVAPGIDAHIALHPVPAAEARAHGARGVEVIGPRTSPRFVPGTAARRAAARARFELPAGARLALVVAGSWGVGDVASTVDDLLATGIATPVVVCGSNASLRRTLSTKPGAYAFGWVDDMPGLMHACDVVIQNAGGLTSLEARAVGLPVLTYRALPGHGETNARALEQAGWAPWARRREDLSCLIEASTDLPGSPGELVDFPWARLAGSAPVPA